MKFLHHVDRFKTVINRPDRTTAAIDAIRRALDSEQPLRLNSILYALRSKAGDSDMLDMAQFMLTERFLHNTGLMDRFVQRNGENIEGTNYPLPVFEQAH